ncbi:glycosyltransferase family 4 protein [Methanobacterium spitsbergense]|uniref:Glycosyltransferase family 4 protein n=1 Tax=Methanobacterium spitsbergense TaxID=2874285 RepID=A0A8T5V4G5_9EURY|nr:glycosyltransferase family 4 protein [Methanobacterium spitsbergense]MBZ2166565.1 glycosyltransferase family 4 protein [Methanobacterium spitsbergense]
MKIAFIYDAVYPWVKGGAEKRVYELAKRLAQRGNEVHWYSIGWWWPENGKKDMVIDGIHLHGVSNPINLYSDDRRSIKEALLFALKLFTPIMKEKFDVVDCQGFPFFSCFTAKIHSMTGKSRLIITLHEVWGDYWYEYLGKLGIFGKFIERTMLGLTDNLITVSYKTQKDLREIKKSEKSIVIPNGIDFNHIQSIKPSEEISDIIFAGRLIKEKNVDILIKSIQIVKQKIPNVRCMIVGDGPERSKLEELSFNLKIQDNIEFMGFTENYNDLIGYMKSSSVFVLPSIREGFGIVVIEANACGLPVVVVNHKMNAAVDLVQDGINGFKADALPEDIADKIIKSIENKEKMESKCIDNSEEYDWNKIVDALEKVYMEIL